MSRGWNVVSLPRIAAFAVACVCVGMLLGRCQVTDHHEPPTDGPVEAATE